MSFHSLQNYFSHKIPPNNGNYVIKEGGFESQTEISAIIFFHFAATVNCENFFWQKRVIETLASSTHQGCQMIYLFAYQKSQFVYIFEEPRTEILYACTWLKAICLISWTFGISFIWYNLWSFGIFSPLWYVVPRKIWQPWHLHNRAPSLQEKYYGWKSDSPYISLSTYIVNF
jgi:hypothetical protein